MTTHVIELEIRRYYKVYIDDPDCSSTDGELIERAKALALENENNLQLDPEMDIEPDDILCANYGYSFDGIGGDYEEEEPRLYRYFLPYRPPMPGAMPKEGIVEMFAQDQRQKMNGCDRPVWGWVQYDRKLTDKEVSDYELIPE